MGPDWAAISALPTTDFAAQQSMNGRRWIEGLPARAAELAERWHLEFEPAKLRNGYNAVVLPVQRDGRRLALKLVWPPETARDEMGALGVWRGRGAVELVAADESGGALLLERLDPERSLRALPIMEAGVIAGTLVRVLAVATATPFPPATAEARGIASTLQARQDRLGRPVPAGWVTAATELAGGLAAVRARGLLIHCDVHYDNILARDRPGFSWVMIDPKPALGDPERSVAELLWTRVDELIGPADIRQLLDTVVRAGELNRQRAVSWAFARTIDYWLWGLENDLTVDPLRCERVAAALEASL